MLLLSAELKSAVRTAQKAPKISCFRGDEAQKRLTKTRPAHNANIERKLLLSYAWQQVVIVDVLTDEWHQE